MEKELRKRQNLLVDAGVGVILFAVWSVVRINLYLGFSEFPMELLYEAAARNGISEKLLLGFMIAVLVGILLWQLSIRLYIGLSATGEGKGKKKSYGYLIWAAILLISDLQINWQTFGVNQILAGEKMTLETIISLCMESASVYVLLQLLITGIRVKILKIKMKV